MIKEITAMKLRLILSVALLLLAGIGTGVFMLGFNQVSSFAKEAQDTATKASASNSSLQDLVATKKTLEDNTDAIDRAAKLVAESKLYLYQDQIITDINQYASEAGLSVSGITFSSPTTTPTGGAATSATTPGAAAPGADATAGATPSGIKSVTATVTLRNPTQYTNILTFLNLIEQSLFRMQVSQISLSKSTQEGGGSGVTSDALTIEVYTR